MTISRLWWLVSGIVLFATFSGSSTYRLQNYSVGPGGTNKASSSTYKLQGNLGEQTNGNTSGSTYSAKGGAIQAEQLNVPPAPTLTNGGGTYYNMINCVINTGGNPSDSTYAIAVSTDNFVTTNYVQANTTLGATPVFQTYTTWGGASGTAITGLTASTTYKVKVSAMQGLFTNTEYGAAASIATVSPTLSFSISPNSTSLGSFGPNSIVTSSNLTINFATNGVSGGTVYVKGQNTGFKSTITGHTIAAYTGDLSSPSEGFGLQATNPTQTSGGPFTTVSPFNGTSHVVGAESTTFAPVLTTTASIVGGSATANVQVKASLSTPPATDYQELMTFIAAASF